MNRSQLKELVREVVAELKVPTIPIGISNRHIHLSNEDFQVLFPNQKLRKLKDLKQPGEFAAEQSVTIIGPKGKLEKVRILGPLRRQTQVEISQTDNRITGLMAPIKMSGDLSEAAEVTIQTPDGSLNCKGCIVAKRHIHMNTTDAASLNVNKNQKVKIKITTDERSATLEDVVIRVDDNFILEMHIDTDEANAVGALPKTTGMIVK